ncbi:MAG: TonB-dependent receptor [Bacteroidota bacterium]
MKKNVLFFGRIPIQFLSTKTIKIMKLSICLLLVTVLQAWAVDSYSQETKLSLDLENVTMAYAIKTIEEKSEFFFLFSPKMVDVTQKVDLHLENEKIDAILDQLLVETDIEYVVKERQIVLTTKEMLQSFNPVQDQPITISGTVSDEDGNPIPGVNIIIKGTTRGAISNANGNYTITVDDPNATLVFSFIGMLSQEILAGSRTVIDIIMIPMASELAEIVVTGYTSQSRRTITGAVETVDLAEIAKNPSTSIEQKLQGQVSGVNVITSGRPGAPVNVRIRGYGTTGDNNPLYVIDGTPSPIGAGLNEINPNDIESISVMKDASAASIYGARGANGVVLITTKKGRQGQAAKITYNSYISIDMEPKKESLLNAQQWAQMEFQGQAAAGLTPSHPTLGTGNTPVIPEYLSGDPSLPYNRPANWLIKSADTDWYDETTEPGLSQSHDLSILGGGKNSRYGVSFGYLNRKGSLIHTGFDRYSTRFNTEFSALNNRLRIGENVSIAYSERLGLGYVPNRMYYNPLIPVYDEGGNFAGTLNGTLGLATNQYNPVAQLTRSKNHIGRTFRTFGNAYLEFDIVPELTYKSIVGINFTQINNSVFIPLYPEGGNPGNSLNEYSGWDSNVVWTNTLDYSKDFGNHSVGVLIGTESIVAKNQFSSTTIQNFFNEDPAFTYISSGSPSTLSTSGMGSQRNLFSLFAKADYSFKHKYLLNATVRRDGSSALGPGNRYDVFPAFGLGWVISDESFLANVSLISLLKIRAGWGKTGNQNSLTDFAFASRFAQDPTATGYDLSASNTGFMTGIGLLTRGNPDLKWETSETINVGLDFSLLKGQISGSIEWYQRTTHGLIVASPLPLTSGVASPPFINIGEIENKGLDMSLGYSAQLGELAVDISGILSTYKNMVIDIDGNPETFIEGRFGNPNIVASRTQAGHELSAFYGLIVDGVIQSGDDAGNFDFRDLNEDGVIDPNDDQDYIGSPHPDFTYGMNINLGYKNIDFTLFLRGSQGNDIWRASKVSSDFHFRSGSNNSTRVLNAWRPDNPSNELAEYNINTATYNLQASSYYLEDGSYLKLQTLQLGYTIPMGTWVDNLRIYLQAQNLFTITKYSGMDPEIQEDGGSLDKGVDSGNEYAIPRSFLLGVNFTF